MQTRASCASPPSRTPLSAVQAIASRLQARGCLVRDGNQVVIYSRLSLELPKKAESDMGQSHAFLLSQDRALVEAKGNDPCPSGLDVFSDPGEIQIEALVAA